MSGLNIQADPSFNNLPMTSRLKDEFYVLHNQSLFDWIEGSVLLSFSNDQQLFASHLQSPSTLQSMFLGCPLGNALLCPTVSLCVILCPFVV